MKHPWTWDMGDASAWDPTWPYPVRRHITLF